MGFEEQRTLEWVVLVILIIKLVEYLIITVTLVRLCVCSNAVHGVRLSLTITGSLLTATMLLSSFVTKLVYEFFAYDYPILKSFAFFLSSIALVLITLYLLLQIKIEACEEIPSAANQCAIITGVVVGFATIYLAIVLIFPFNTIIMAAIVFDATEICFTIYTFIQSSCKRISRSLLSKTRIVGSIILLILLTRLGWIAAYFIVDITVNEDLEHYLDGLREAGVVVHALFSLAHCLLPCVLAEFDPELKKCIRSRCIGDDSDDPVANGNVAHSYGTLVK